MALPSSRIYLRSPYFVSLERVNLSKIFVELYIYTGTLTTDKPSDYTIRAVSDSYVLANGNYRAQIDIAVYARDYVEVTYSGSNESAAVWVEYDLYYADEGDSSLTLYGSYSLTGLDGGGYFEDGFNYAGLGKALMTSDYVITPRGKGINIPVLQDDFTGFRLAKNAVLLYSQLGLTPTENTANVVYYVDTGFANTADRCILKFDSGNMSDQTIEIRYVDECLNDSIKVTFVNKYGALQDLYFFGRYQKQMNTTSETYKRNLLSEGGYNTKRHQNYVLNKNSIDTITLNSGFYPEDSNGTFIELMNSEQVWITLGSDIINGVKTSSTNTVYPVNIKTSNLQFKTRLYDKLINYKIDFEIANDKISTVR